MLVCDSTGCKRVATWKEELPDWYIGKTTNFWCDYHAGVLRPNSSTWVSLKEGIMEKLDRKFEGTITKVKDGSIVPDDQWMCFLVKDNAFAEILPIYLAKCIKMGCDEEQIDAVLAAIKRVQAWRKANPDKLKRPDAAGEKLL